MPPSGNRAKARLFNRINFTIKRHKITKRKARHLNPPDGGSGEPWKERGTGVLAMTVGRSTAGLWLDVDGHCLEKDGQAQKINGGWEVAFSAYHRLDNSQHQADE